MSGINFDDLDSLRRICQKIADGKAVDSDRLESDPISVPLPEGKTKQDLPPGFLPLFEHLYEVESELRKRITATEALIQVLGSAAVHLIDELNKLRDN